MRATVVYVFIMNFSFSACTGFEFLPVLQIQAYKFTNLPTKSDKILKVESSENRLEYRGLPGPWWGSAATPCWELQGGEGEKGGGRGEVPHQKMKNKNVFLLRPYVVPLKIADPLRVPSLLPNPGVDFYVYIACFIPP